MKKTMKSILMILAFAFLANIQANAQMKDSSKYVSMLFDDGLTLSLNQGKYTFTLGGFIQPAMSVQAIEDAENQLFFNARRAFMHIGGTAVDEKLSFFIQTNFSESRPLYDAWIAYHPLDNLTLTFGQKQNIANNREMLYREDRLQFTDRSFLSQQLSKTGREFGLFAEYKLKNPIGLVPQLSITTGDGRNSFGVDSRDVDLGGLKYSGRLDIYPFGYFKNGNDLFSSDLLREEKPKVVIGTAFSYNTGATNMVGEGHGDFLLYDENGDVSLPDYRQFFIDVLAKYQGFSALIEFGNASATGLAQNFADAGAIQRLAPGQISNFLMLGNSLNTQFGYVLPSGLSFDVRYGQSQPEFTAYTGNLLGEDENITLGVTKYFKGHKTKVQSAFSYLNWNTTNSGMVFELLAQMSF